MKKRIIVSVLIAVIAILFIAGPVYAYITNPTSMSISSCKAFRNVTKPGDMAIVFHGKVNYTVYPGTAATDCIVFRLRNGSTVLGTTSPYVYGYFGNNGFGDIVSGMYFESGLTWGTGYSLDIVGLPAYFTGLSPVTYTMTAADYNSANSTQEYQQEEMYDYIIQLCDEFKVVYPDYPLKATSIDGIVLSQYGEAYLLGAIPGLLDMCPQLFYMQVFVPERMDVEAYSMYLATLYGQQTENTDLKRGADRIGGLIGVDGQVILAIIVILLCIWISVKIVKKGWGIEWAGMISFLVMMGAAVIVGEIIFTLVMLVSLGGVIALGWILKGKRA